MARVLASTTTAEYLGAEELAPKAKLQKNKIKKAIMPEKISLQPTKRYAPFEIVNNYQHIPPKNLLFQTLL